ncbi:MAG: hypothetical protein ACKVOB_04330 [Sphingomonas sp.]
MSAFSGIGAFFNSGHAADLVLAVLAAEAVWLVACAGWPVWKMLLCLMPGALMMVALRAALTGAGWPWVALALAASFPVHVADIWYRKERAGSPTRQPRP